MVAHSVIVKRGEPLVEGGVGTARGGTLGVGIVVTLRGREAWRREALMHGGEMKTSRADAPSDEPALCTGGGQMRTRQIAQGLDFYGAESENLTVIIAPGTDVSVPRV